MHGLRDLRLNLAHKLNLLTLGAVLVPSVLLAGYFVHRGTVTSRTWLLESGRTLAQIMAENCEYAVYTEDKDYLARTVGSLAVNRAIAYIAVIDKTGKIIVEREFRSGVQRPAPRVGALGRQAGLSGTEVEVPGPPPGPYIDLVVPVLSEAKDDLTDPLRSGHRRASDPRAIGYLQMGISLEDVEQRRQELIVSAAVFVSAVLALGLALTLALTRRIVAPLKMLSHAARQISQGDLDQSLEVRSGDEVAQLGTSFNHMLERLRAYRRAEEQQQRTLEEQVERRTEELRASEGRNRALLNAVPDVMLRVTEKGEVLDLQTSQPKHRFGFPETATGCPLDALLGPRVAAQLMESAKTALARNTMQVMEYQLDAGVPDPPRLFEARAVVSGPEEVLLMLRDTTERKQMEQRLALADRMASLGTLAAGVAHEINNPLAYIMSNLEFVQERLGAMSEGDPARRFEGLLVALADSRSGAERVAAIVRNLKAFSRPDETVNLVDVRCAMDGAVDMAWTEIKHRARLVKSYQEVPPVTANEARLGQVLLNLLVNAAQAMPEGAADANIIEVRTAFEGGWVQIEVRDTGQGIAPEHLARIYDPFFTTKPVGTGTGLGLAICHSIVTGLGGHLKIENNPDRGVTARVLLRAARASAVHAAVNLAEPEPPPHTGGARILVVDDDPQIARSIARVLSSHQVRVTTDGEEAVQICEGESFDIVFCDLMMPTISGMEVFERVGRTSPALLPRFIFMTGAVSNPQVAGFLAGVANLCIEKPFDAGELKMLVAQTLQTAGVS
jgi:C4-dicarboxylate-specific signal transduction histidine kinase/CheY-like chemotaxis protein